MGPGAVSRPDCVGVWVTGTELMIEVCLMVKMARVRDVTMNKIADAVVSLLRNVAAPLLPKSVWLEPPKAAPISAPLLLWINMIKIKNMQTIR